MIRLVLALPWLLLSAAATAQSPSDFHAKAVIELEGGGPYYRLTLPIQVHFAAHSPELRDLRVFNGQGETVPFSLIRDQARTERAEQQIALKWFPLYAADATPDSLRQVRIERRSDGTVVSVLDSAAADAGPQKLRGYLLDISQAKGAARTLDLDWDPTVAGFQQLSVEASDDLQTWQRWEGSAQLARLEFNGGHVERRQIDLPGGHAAYLRLTWHEPAVAPALTAAVLTVGSSTDRPASFVWSEAMAASRSETGSYEWHYPQPVAIERLKIALPQINVLTPVELFAKDERAQHEWRLLTRTVLYRLLINGKELQQPEVSLSTAPVLALRLVPDARGGGLGGGTPTLSVGVTAQQLLFLARGARPFTLAVGKDGTKQANLTPAILVPGYGSPGAPPISAALLGPVTSAGPADAAPEAPAGRWQMLVLWAVLLLGISAIGIMAARLLRETKA
jgi:hypothetical protein